MPEIKSGPIIVCTRNDDLEGVVAATPEQRRKGKWLTSPKIAAFASPLLDGEACPQAQTCLLHICRPCLHTKRHAAALVGGKGLGRHDPGEICPGC